MKPKIIEPKTGEINIRLVKALMEIIHDKKELLDKLHKENVKTSMQIYRKNILWIRLLC